MASRSLSSIYSAPVHGVCERERERARERERESARERLLVLHLVEMAYTGTRIYTHMRTRVSTGS